MQASLSVLKDGHRYNSPRLSDSAQPWTTQVKHGHGSMAQTSDIANNGGFAENSLPCLRSPFTKISMDGALKETTPFTKLVPLTYLVSPIRTLKESTTNSGNDLLTHDLVESYNILSNRLRKQIHLISSPEEPLDFLTPVKEESPYITACLVRDIRCVLPNVLQSQHRHSLSLADLSCYSEAVPSDDGSAASVDNAILCQYALCLASDILTFPALYSNFTDEQLISLLREVVSLCNPTGPPILNLPKFCGMAVWLLKVQQLPLSILLPLKDEISSALQNCISHQLGGVSKLDSFKALHCILERHPSLGVSFMDLLPLVLDHLNCKSPEVQLHAALALSGFASAKMSCKGQFPLEQASKIIQTYLNAKAPLTKPTESESHLLTSFKSVLAEGSQWKWLGPSFVLSAISCFLVLLDHSFYASPRCVRFIVTILRECARHKVGAVSAVQPEIWKILFWAFSRIPLSLDQDTSDGKPGIRKRAYGLVCEDLRHGRRLHLVRSLLAIGTRRARDRSELDISRAIDTVSDILEDPTSRNEGIAILSRMMADIGAPSMPRGVDSDHVSFSRNLIDGTLLSQRARDINIPPMDILIERITPLSEAEVLQHWEKLCKLFISVAQQDLLSGQDFSPETLQVWQALLLVHGNLTPGHQHLSAAPSFGVRVASIVTSATMALNTTEMQIRYLSFIWKLWAVMKNVFTTNWLSVSAENILASLLKTQFMLSDDQVKGLWSQLCGDLISVGIPTLLHVLHRMSESQEETELTRQLWLVLAENGPLVTAQEEWEDLLQFLVMPFGVWEISDPDFDIWRITFKRALGLAERAARTPNDVISQFIRLFKGDKLTSLRQSFQVLHWLLIQSTTPSYSRPSIELICLIDEQVFSGYGATVQKKEMALDTLRVIGNLISKTKESEIVQLLSTLQKSLSCWIADAKTLLDDHGNNELVDILYKPSLEILARVEPSITVLQSVATFLQSGFVHIRGDGPLAFHKFWRATYHKRPDIPKNDYPLPIREYLKAWGDIIDDSLADGISLDSGSQSLRSYLIPDSQPLEANISGEVDYDFDISFLGPDQPVYITTHEYLSPGDPATRITQSRTTGFSVIEGGRTTALPALQEDTSNYNNLETISQQGDNTSFFVTNSKRLADSELPHTPKRFRQESANVERRAREERAEDLYFSPSLSGGTRIKASVSESMIRASSVSSFPSKPASQLSHPRPRHRSDDTFSWVGSDLRKLQIPKEDQAEERMEDLPSDDYDYDSWEKYVSEEDLRNVQTELEHPDFAIPSSEDNPIMGKTENGNLDMDHLADHDDHSDQDILSPSLDKHILQARRRQRSQTAPEPSSSLYTMHIAQPLRRNQTTPIVHKKSSSAQLEALRRAYAIVADTGTSQIDVQDIMHARRLANQINQVLDEQMLSKFGDRIPR